MRPASWASSATELPVGWARQLLLLGVAFLILLTATWVVDLPRHSVDPISQVGLHVQPLAPGLQQAGAAEVLRHLPDPGVEPVWRPTPLPLNGGGAQGLAGQGLGIW